MRLQRIRDGTLGRPPGAPAPDPQVRNESVQDAQDNNKELHITNGQASELVGSQSRKRKAEEDSEVEHSVTKRGKSSVLPEDSSGGSVTEDIQPPKSLSGRSSSVGQEMQLPSRPATPQKVPHAGHTPAAAARVDENEWAAFEADIAATVATNAVISAPAMSAAEEAAKAEEAAAARRKNETDGEKEDAARKLEVEFDEMDALEARIRRLKEKREAIRLKGGVATAAARTPLLRMEEMRTGVTIGEEDDKDLREEGEGEGEELEEEDEWDSFRFKVSGSLAKF